MTPSEPTAATEPYGVDIQDDESVIDAIVLKYRAMGFPVSVEMKDGKRIVVVGSATEPTNDYMDEMLALGKQTILWNGGAEPPKTGRYDRSENDDLLRKPSISLKQRRKLLKKLKQKS